MESIMKKLKSESGAVQIVEASFVFPIMFIILFFLIFMGNAFYVKAQVESVVEEYALQGAAYCADPILATLKETGSMPSAESIEIDPYRYIFTSGMSDVENDIETAVKNDISSGSKTFFNNMEPKLSSSGCEAKYNNHVIYSTFSVDVKYTITFPIRFLGSDEPVILSLESRAEAPVDDTTEFIRNTDMVIDMLDKFGVTDKIEGIFDKIESFLGSFKS